MEQERSSKEGYELIAEHILDYLNRHPYSKDTLRGIAEWWLESRCIEESVEQVSQALGFLCSQGIVMKEESIRGPVFYRLKTKKIYKPSG